MALLVSDVQNQRIQNRQFVKKGASGPVLTGQYSKPMGRCFLALALCLISSSAAAQGISDPDGSALVEPETGWLVSFLGGLHPFSVHFPIALVCVQSVAASSPINGPDSLAISPKITDTIDSEAPSARQ